MEACPLLRPTVHRFPVMEIYKSVPMLGHQKCPSKAPKFEKQC